MAGNPFEHIPSTKFIILGDKADLVIDNRPKLEARGSELERKLEQVPALEVGGSNLKRKVEQVPALEVGGSNLRRKVEQVPTLEVGGSNLKRKVDQVLTLDVGGLKHDRKAEQVPTLEVGGLNFKRNVEAVPAKLEAQGLKPKRRKTYYKFEVEGSKLTVPQRSADLDVFVYPLCGVIYRIPIACRKKGKRRGPGVPEIMHHFSAFHPENVHVLSTEDGHLGIGVITFRTGLDGLKDALAFDRWFIAREHGLKDWERKCKLSDGVGFEMYGWLARKEDYEMELSGGCCDMLAICLRRIGKLMDLAMVGKIEDWPKGGPKSSEDLGRHFRQMINDSALGSRSAGVMKIHGVEKPGRDGLNIEAEKLRKMLDEVKRKADVDKIEAEEKHKKELEGVRSTAESIYKEELVQARRQSNYLRRTAQATKATHRQELEECKRKANVLKIEAEKEHQTQLMEVKRQYTFLRIGANVTYRQELEEFKGKADGLRIETEAKHKQELEEAKVEQEKVLEEFQRKADLLRIEAEAKHKQELEEFRKTADCSKLEAEERHKQELEQVRTEAKRSTDSMEQQNQRLQSCLNGLRKSQLEQELQSRDERVKFIKTFKTELDSLKQQRDEKDKHNVETIQLIEKREEEIKKEAESIQNWKLMVTQHQSEASRLLELEAAILNLVPEKVEGSRCLLLESLEKKVEESDKHVAELERQVEDLKEENENFHTTVQALTQQHRIAYAELEEARKLSLSALDVRESDTLCIRRMGEIDEKPWKAACQRRYRKCKGRCKDGWDVVSKRKFSEWENMVRNHNFHPFKHVEVGDDKWEQQVDTSNKELHALRIELGDEVLQTVVTALKEIEEHNASGRYPIRMVWNSEKQERATVSEVINHLLEALDPKKKGVQRSAFQTD